MLYDDSNAAVKVQGSEVTIRELRAHLAEVLAQVKHGQQRMIVSKYDRKVAALISLEDLRLLESLERISGIVGPLPATPMVELDDDSALPTHFGPYGTRYLYYVHARNPIEGKRMFLNRVREHARTGSIPDLSDTFYERTFFGQTGPWWKRVE